MKQLICTLLKSVLTFAAMVTLASCSGSGSGGGGGGGSASSTITSITPVGMVQSASAQPLYITGTNFANGMTISVTDSVGGTYTTGTLTVTSSKITSSVTIPTAPTDRYVTVAIKSSTGTILTSTILGVASVSKTLSTDIQPIFDANCVSCHGGNGGLYLDSANAAANLIQTNSVGCSSRFRVTAGDPRRSSSVLIDKIKVASTGIAACSGSGMPLTGPALTTPNILDIVEWVAGGAN